MFHNNITNAHFFSLSRVIHRRFSPKNCSHVFLDDFDLFLFFTNSNAKKPLEDGPLCKTDTFQFSKSFCLKRFEFFNNSFTTREKSVLYRETTPLH